MIKSPIYTRAKIVIVSGTALVMTIMIGAANAQSQDDELARGQGVRDRDRPEYDAYGLRAGAFRLFPSATLSTSANDNIYAVAGPEQDDVIFAVEPNLQIESTWSRHALSAEAGGRIERYADITSENNNEFYGRLNGAVDVHDGSQLTGSFYYGSLVESRTNNSLDEGNAVLLTVEPITYDVLEVNAGASHIMNRVRLSGGYTFSSYNYDDQRLIAGGVSNQDVRDHDVSKYLAQADLAVSPDTSLFARGSLTIWDYDLAPPDAPFDRDSNGFEVAGGANFKLGRLASGEVFVGYQERSFDDDPRFSTVKAVDYGAAVHWFVSELTTVTVEAESDIKPSTVSNASSFVRQSARLTVDHELFRNILLQGRFWYGRDKFDDIARIDEWTSAGGRVDYFLNRRIGLFASFDYIDQDSDVPINSFDQKVFVVGAKLQL